MVKLYKLLDFIIFTTVTLGSFNVLHLHYGYDYWIATLLTMGIGFLYCFLQGFINGMIDEFKQLITQGLMTMTIEQAILIIIWLLGGYASMMFQDAVRELNDGDPDEYVTDWLMFLVWPVIIAGGMLMYITLKLRGKL